VKTLLPYKPTQLPPEKIDFQILSKPTGDATADLCRYDGLVQGIVNPSIFLSPLTTQEAVLSSKIEGTQATVDEVLEKEAGMKLEISKERDVQEIINYREALHKSREYLVDYPVTLSFICGLHKILLNSVRGNNKNPGQLRHDQNWIGRPGAAIEEASFVPPPPMRLRDHLEDLLKFLHDDKIDPLIQSAIGHAQFELIHPFDDGNGRIGRILIPLFLYSKKRISEPVFYISAYLESHRDEYYNCLQGISKYGDWNGWILFFLRAVSEQSRINCDKIHRIMTFYEEMKTELQNLTHSQYTITVLDEIFSRPIFSSTDFIARTGIPRPTANKILYQMKDVEILTELRPASGRQPTVYAFRQLLGITESP